MSADLPTTDRPAIAGTATRRRVTRATLVLVTAAAGVAAMTAAAAGASAAPAGSAGAASATGVTTKAVAASEQQATLAYWTPQRLASAKNADLLTVSSPAATPNARAPRPTGPAGLVAGSRVAAKPVPASGAVTASYPFPYSISAVSPSTAATYPYAVNGKIFFTNNGGNYVCSGTSVASAHGTSLENEVWTAGHCVSNTNERSPGVFDSFAEFIPAYNGNSSNYAPLGVYVANSYSVATNWLNHADLSVDEAAMQVGTNSWGRTLGQTVGYDGFAWNWSPSENFTTFGYPAAYPYNGTTMYKDVSSTGTTVNMGGAGQPAIGIGSPMTGGSSGGAWDIGWSTSGAGWINGHNDFKFTSQPLAMYSPYQDSLTNTVRCFGASSC